MNQFPSNLGCGWFLSYSTNTWYPKRWNAKVCCNVIASVLHTQAVSLTTAQADDNRIGHLQMITESYFVSGNLSETWLYSYKWHCSWWSDGYDGYWCLELLGNHSWSQIKVQMQNAVEWSRQPGIYLPTSQHHAYLHWLPDWWESSKQCGLELPPLPLLLSSQIPGYGDPSGWRLSTLS